MKKLYIFFLLVTGFITAMAQQPVSFSVQADADDWQLYMSNHLMDDFNNNAKVVFITLTAGDEGNGTASFNGSSLSYYRAREKGGVYSAKFACDISVNGAVCTIDSIPGLQTVTVNGHSLVKYVYKNSVSYFLRLPDGGSDGNGFVATGNKSLKKLKAGSITSLTSVDGANTYTGWADLTATLTAIINAEKGTVATTWLNTGSTDAAFNPNDYSDHLFAATAAKDATANLLWIGYIDYVNDNSSNFPVNLTISKFQDAAGIFGVADYALTENKYVTKLTANNIKLLTADSFKIVRSPVTCTAPGSLTAGSVSSGSAVLSWRKVTGAVSYQVDTKIAGGSWVIYNTSVADSFVTVNGLVPSTTYQWRVKTNCSGSGNSSAYTEAQFTTSNCTDILEYNNSYYYAKSVTPGQNYNAQIAYNGDVDYYQFNNTSNAKNIKITLTNLPGDYDVKLYNQCGLLVGTSQNWGTSSETIIFNTGSFFDVGTYRINIYGYAGAYSSTSCYSFKAEISSTAFVQPVASLTMRSGEEKPETVDLLSADERKLESSNTTAKVNALTVYPIPVYSEATMAFEGTSEGKGLLTILDTHGCEVIKKTITVRQGHNIFNVNMINLASGVYTASLRYGTSVITKQIIISR
jgi:Fibronectin type III domain